MINVSGKVLVKETGLGIANLLVLLYDVDSRIKLKSVFQAKNIGSAMGLIEPSSQSIGSDITDQNGHFSIHCPAEYENATNSGSTRSNPNLLLLVSAPEEPGSAQSGRLLYVSPKLRTSIGNYETYLIQLKEDQLDKSGLLNFVHTHGRQAHITSAALSSESKVLVRRALTKAAADLVQKSREDRKQYKGFEKKFIRSISHLPENLIHGDLLVGLGASVEAINQEAISSGVAGRINQKKRKTRFYLTEDQAKQLSESLGNNGTISFDEFRQLAMQNGQGSKGVATPQLIRHQELVIRCLNKIRDESEAERLLFGEKPDENPGGDRRDGSGDRGGRGVRLTNTDGLPAFVARLMDTATSPEEAVSFGLLPSGGRPTQEDVQASVNGLFMEPGPADRPAFFDFHSLQIAFDHVWQELISDEILEGAEQLYRRLIDIGGDPEAEEHSAKPPLEALRDETAAVEVTLQRGENPAAYNMSGAGIAYKPYTNTQRDGEDHHMPPRGGGSSPRWSNWLDVTVDTAPADAGFYAPPPQSLYDRLEALLNRAYAFTVFGANSKERSVNFGIIVTYRQKWTPVAYQVGNLAKTITLAPRETRKFTRKLTVKRKRSEKEVEKASALRREEYNQTSRAEAEIMRKARSKTNFNLSTDGTYNFGIAEGTSEIDFGKEAEQESAETKKDFREAVFKAAQEYKNERSLEVETETIEELEESESGEITNPNDELAVTFLFYELQRRYRLHEEIHRVTPVVLVAQEVPKPNEITDAWLIAHDWILKRSFLDDSFRPALDYLSLRYAGDMQALAHLQQDLSLHREIVKQLRDDLVALKRKEATAYGHLQAAIEERAAQVREEDTDGFWSDVGDFFGGDGESPEAARILEEAAKDAVDRAAAEVKELTMRLEREVTALNAASEKYQKVLVEHNNWKIQIERLKLHVKDNILYYMQAIWLHEVPDQRYFRLFQVKVPTFAENGSAYQVISSTNDELVISTVDGPDVATAVDMEITPSLTVKFDPAQLKSLVEVADLDKLLGFKGNYMIFPLRESNPLTDIMMDPYANTGFSQIMSLVDPDEAGNMSREDFAQYVVCLHEALGDEEFDKIKGALKSQYRRILQTANRPGEEIIVPSGSLYIEALPATHPLLEDFKLIHRAVDVKKVQAEVREMELENVRQAERILQGQLEDPDIEKKIVIEGDGTNVIVPPGDE